jgi:PucR C-terminal helix-turn-helix domain
VSNALRPKVPHLVDEMIDAIRAEIPAYDRPLQGDFGERVRGSTAASVERFLNLIAGEERDHAHGSDLYVELGRNEVRSGRPIDTLLGAYRIGARVMWRGFAAEGQSKGIEPEVLYRLAEALFAYVDELSHESADGYAEELAQRHGARERERERLLDVLMRRDPPADPVVVHAQAARAEWKLPEQIAPVATPAARMPARQLEHRLPDGSMAATREGITVALVPDLDTPGRTAELERALEGAPAARGAQIGTLEAAEEVERATLAVALQEAGVLPQDGILDTGDHLVALILHRDPARAHSLADRALAPLDRLSPATRAKLTETLDAWLDNACSTGDTARSLHVHMQTLRYRLRQLEEVFGAEHLKNGERRLELQLALKVRRES